MTADTYQFADPPPSTRGPRSVPDWRTFGEANPGRWFIYKPDANHPNAPWNTTRKPAGWEYATRRNPDRLHTIYVRYNPETPS